ncbi:MAG: glutathione S-transferase [Amaricoccus sp.]
MTYVLAIGDRSYSSWSLRGWLMFARFGIPATLRTARLYTPDFPRLLADFGIARTAPALAIEADGRRLVLWDTLAMAETLAERHPDAGLWPADPAQRATARTLAAEMHAGFHALRRDCPMNLRRAYLGFEPSAEVRADLARLEALWAYARAAAGEGPWLLGAYSLADVFFAPVATRIATYGLPVGPEAAAYVVAHLSDPTFRSWRAAGAAEGYVQAGYDLDLPERPWPGPEPLRARAVSDVDPVNAVCPSSGEPVDPNSLAEIGGVVVGFCNPFCRDKVVADPEAWPAAMALVHAARR